MQHRHNFDDLYCTPSIDKMTPTHLRQKYICFEYKVYKTKKERLVIPELSNFAIHFPTKNEMNKILMTKSLYLQTRLLGHFKELNETTARKCRNACLNDKHCIASSFTELN